MTEYLLRIQDRMDAQGFQSMILLYVRAFATLQAMKDLGEVFPKKYPVKDPSKESRYGDC